MYFHSMMKLLYAKIPRAYHSKEKFYCSSSERNRILVSEGLLLIVDLIPTLTFGRSVLEALAENILLRLRS